MSEPPLKPAKTAENTQNHLVWKVVLMPVLMVVLALVFYSPMFEAGTIWDDDAYVTLNRNLWTTQGLIDTWLRPRSLPQYYPLVHTTYWLEYRLWGVQPTGYHLVNILLHALSGFLLWRLLRRLAVPGAALAAAILVVHPVHVESVAWITERKNTLSMVFYLASALAMLRLFNLPGERPPRLGWKWYAPALLMFLAALCSKTVSSTLPAAALVVLWWQRGRIERREVLALAPFFILSLAMGRVTAWLEIHHVGAWGRDWDFTIIERCLIAGRVVWFYLWKLLWPAELMFIYPRWRIDTGVWWQWLFPLAALALLVASWALRKRIGRGPAAAVMLYFGTLSPALGFFNIYPMRFSFVADHFVYLASLAPIAAAAAGLALLARKVQRPGLSVVVAAGLLAVLGLRTWSQCHWYHDARTLWTRTLQQNPGATVAYYYLADMATAMNQHDEAVSLMRQAVSVSPGDPQPMSNLGLMLSKAGRRQEAIDVLRQAASIYDRPEPAAVLTHQRLAPLLLDAGDWSGAAASCEFILQARPGNVSALRMLALARWGGGDAAAAADAARRLIDQHPQQAVLDDYRLLAAALARLGQPEQAAAVMERARQRQERQP